MVSRAYFARFWQESVAYLYPKRKVNPVCMFIFIDESGITDAKGRQQFLVVSFVLMNNRAFSEELIVGIKDACAKKGKPIKNKEVKYHDLTAFQKEIAVKAINSNYRNFYLCFVDIEHAPKTMADGLHEQEIQTRMIHSVLSKLDIAEMRKSDRIRVIMDKKLSSAFQKSIEEELQRHLGTKKGIEVETANSGKERGIQVADIIAGAFRAKLMKKSDLFEVDHTRIFQITIGDVEKE